MRRLCRHAPDGDVLIVVAVGGLGRVTGVFYAALLIGVLDFVLKKYVPQGGRSSSTPSRS